MKLYIQYRCFDFCGSFSMFSKAINVLKKLTVKVSSSCSEDLDLNERETKLHGSRFCNDHQTSVIFAKDLKKRSQEASAVNPVESLNILLEGRLKMKKYSEEEEEEDSCKTVSRDLTLSNAYTLQDTCSNRKLPQENPEQEILNWTDNTLYGKDKGNTTESISESLNYAEYGCDSKSENKESKNNTTPVKSSECSKETRGTSERLTTSTKNNNSSSCGSGDGDGDEDDNDKDRNRRRVQEKFDGDLISENSEEEAGKVENPEEMESIEVVSQDNSGHDKTMDVNKYAICVDETCEHEVLEMQIKSSKGEEQCMLAKERASVKDEDASVKDEEVSVKDEDASVKDEDASVKDEDASVKDEDASVKDEDASVKDEDASVKDEDASVKDEDASVKDEDASCKDHNASCKDDASDKDEEVSVMDEDVSVMDEDMSVMYEDTFKDEGSSLKDEDLSIKHWDASFKDEDAPVMDQDASVKDDDAPVKDEDAPVKDEDMSIKEDASVKKDKALIKGAPSVIEQNASVKKKGVSEKKHLSIKNELAIKEWRKSSSLDLITSNKMKGKSSNNPTGVVDGSISLAAAFKCYGEKSGSFDRCKNSKCYTSHLQLEHSRQCKFRVLGGCKMCTELRDIYLYHTRDCSDDICTISRCWRIKKYLKETPSLTRWSYHADNIFFEERFTDANPLDIPQDEPQKPVTTEEIKEFLESLKTPQSSMISSENYSCHEASSSNFVRGRPGAGQMDYMCPPTRPPDEKELSLNVLGIQTKAPISEKAFNITEIDEEKALADVIHSRGASIHTDVSTNYCQGDTIQVPDGSAIPRPENVKLLLPFSESCLNVKEGQYDEGHEWRIVQENNFLGRGAYGECRLCTDLASNKLFAIKKIKKEKFDYNELKIWAIVSGDSVRCLDLFGAVCVDKYVIMFMEYMEGGSVENMLNYLPENRFDENTALYITREVLEGLDFLHCRNIIHRDIKGGNILVNDTLTKVKLADYGAAVQLDKQEFSKQDNNPPGTENFMSPEVCRSEEHSFSADIWSSGCVLYQMLKGQPPWIEFASVIYKVGTTKEPPEFPHCSKGTKGLLSQMFALVPKNRPTAKELLRHSAIEKVNEHPCITVEGEDEGESGSESEDGNIKATKSSCDDEFFSFEASSSNSDEDGDDLFGTPKQTPSPAEEEELGMDGTNHTFGSLHQAHPPAEEDKLEIDGTNQTFGSLHQVQPTTEDDSRHALDGPSQMFESLHQTHLPVGDDFSFGTGGAGQFFGSAFQIYPSVEDDGRCALGTIPVDDELQSLQSELVRMVSFSGGDVSNLVGVIGNTDAVENPDDVFDETVFLKSITEPMEENGPTHSPGSPYSMKDLTKVDLYDENGLLLFTIREKSSCTFGNLAENIHSKILENTAFLRCFTFKTKEGGVIDPTHELGFLNHTIQVLPAERNDQWSEWRVDKNGIVELKACSYEAGVSRSF